MAIVAVEPVRGAEPHKTETILYDAVDGGLREAVLDRKAIEMSILALGE